LLHLACESRQSGVESNQWEEGQLSSCRKRFWSSKMIQTLANCFDLF